LAEADYRLRQIPGYRKIGKSSGGIEKSLGQPKSNQTLASRLPGLAKREFAGPNREFWRPKPERIPSLRLYPGINRETH
jgi:hypothetical protein